MKSSEDFLKDKIMSRRNVLLGVALGGAVAFGGSVIWLADGVDKQSLTMDNAIAALDQLMAENVITHGVWNLSQILIHCAQSVEYSMEGYPEHKSELFKHTLGSLAFSAFSKKGEMRHGLNEAIPGAPSIQEFEEVRPAYQRFREAMITFKHYSGQLAPHFAYGELNKGEYERAHAMHFYNHLLEIEFN